MSILSLGTIEKLEFHNKGGYFKLKVYIPGPERDEDLRFYVCNSKANLLQNKATGKKFKVGDIVRVAQRFDGHLDELIPATENDTCYINRLLGENVTSIDNTNWCNNIW